MPASCHPRIHAVALALATLASPVLAAPVDLGASARLREAVTVEGVSAHLRALEAIAVEHGGNRAAGTAGHDASADYVGAALTAAGYTVRRERFDFPFFQETAPPVLRVAGEPMAAGDLRTLRGSAGGRVEAALWAVDAALPAVSASTSGCEAADFAGFPRGAVALVRRGTCTFKAKIENAAAAGAVAVVIMNEGRPNSTDTFSGGVEGSVAVPAVAVASDVGERLAGPPGLAVTLRVEARSGTRTSFNVLAERAAAADGPLVLVGAHLDSVTEGPGINDNGSGVAVVLETALQLARQEPRAAERLRVAFWGAEEVGLVGSRHHAGRLTPAERSRIAAVLNLDMVGSPNPGRFVYRPGTDRDGRPPAGGSLRIERLLTGYLDAVGLPWRPTPMRGGSDHAPFAALGMAVGGIYSGAGEAMSQEQARLFDGEPGSAFDPCYHEACDTTANIDLAALEQHADALAHALLTLARELDHDITRIEDRATGRHVRQPVRLG